MRHEQNSRRLFGITRSKGKMYELGLPESQHISVPQNSDPEELFLLTVGTLGDVAATLNADAGIENSPPAAEKLEEISFASRFFDAFIESRFNDAIERDVMLLAASAYFLANRPGSSLVLAKRISDIDDEPAVDKLLRLVLQTNWKDKPDASNPQFGADLEKVANLLELHFNQGESVEQLNGLLMRLRKRAYEFALPRELLFVDLIVAISRMRLSASAWIMLPKFTGVSASKWEAAIRRPHFLKGLWPSQMQLGRAEIFSGASGVVQMPTSAGKTRSVEIVLRSGFLAARTKLAVVVAPFRALCHEISNTLQHAFKEDDVKVNELSDAMQLDFLFAELGAQASSYILILTPEKLLYVLRQKPNLVADIGIVIYDEGHQFDDGSRGVTYELLLTEIKTVLPQNAQTILISAVIQNAKAIGSWLIGDHAKIVEGTGLLPTARSVAFASWIDTLGHLIFFESDFYNQPDFYVPRVLERHFFDRRGKERKDRSFPEKSSSTDVALYLGIKLAPNGSVAIFCGRKETASGIASRVVEIYDRGFKNAPPSSSADSVELRRMKFLIDAHFGAKSELSLAASLGVFVHHGTTPHGLRLAIEHAMQRGLINFVACTSTLAQGVNLPIRYLIVAGIHQGENKIKTRDFQNLVGRAGRSGMHTEGLVIFSDVEVFDGQKQYKTKWKFPFSRELLQPALAESTTSSLLTLLAPIQSVNGMNSWKIPTDRLCDLLLRGNTAWPLWAENFLVQNPLFISEKGERIKAKRDAKAALVRELRNRRRLMVAVESYLMANRGVSSFDDFKSKVEKLAASTLAYHVATEDKKIAVRSLFLAIAEYVQQLEPTTNKQALYSKTLLGVASAKAVEQWVTQNRHVLMKLNSNKDWLRSVWGMICDLSDDKFFHSVLPDSIGATIAAMWINGDAYQVLIETTARENATKPYGEKRRKLAADDILKFCENTLGFDCALLVGAVAEFLFGGNDGDESSALKCFQKALKYGLPDWLSISCYEHGFSDRMIAQRLCFEVREGGFSGDNFEKAISPHKVRLALALNEFPSYFTSVLSGR